MDCCCTDEGCNYTDHNVEEWHVSDNKDYHKGTCSACGSEIEYLHVQLFENDKTEHWIKCALCDYEIEGLREKHIYGDYFVYNDESHYRWCNECGYNDVEKHSDDNGDSFCEKCGEEIHTCYSEDGDHFCDDCYTIIPELCTDEDNNHICDDENCGEYTTWLCKDENTDHVCDIETCGRHMREICEDDDYNYYCDICGQNCCYHYLEALVSNGDGTHSGTCYYCGEEASEECWEYDYYSISTHHVIECACGYRILYGEHTYEYGYCNEISVAGHWLECDFCGHMKFSPHSFSEGICEGCGAEEEKVYDVYVAGIGLEDGKYIDNNKNVTGTKPSGGYAYYKDGILELNNFEFEGQGLLCKEYMAPEYPEKYYAAVFGIKDLTIKLTGENILGETSTDYESGIWGDAVVVFGNLTVDGSGSLLITAADDGFEVEGGNLTIEDGDIKIGYEDYDEEGLLINGEVLDDGFDVRSGNLIIKDGLVTVISDDHGADVEGDFIMSGGYFDIIADDDGLNIEKDVTVSGGRLTVIADDYGIDSDQGNVYISGGDTYISAEYYDGIDADNEVVITGGKVYAQGGEDGIEASKVTILAGNVRLNTNMLAIDADEIIISNLMKAYDFRGNTIEEPDFDELYWVELKMTVAFGDVNGDEKVNVMDANLIRRYAAKLADLTEEQLIVADVDGNGKVNVLDANLIRRYAAKLVHKFPVEG